jgi:threonylcarbamoyladenosine tRNA methylthiotransferase MtaB
MRNPAHALQPYLHIPLQAGSDEILKSMRRKYILADFLGFLDKANERIPDLCIGTDLMVGFPGETEALFEQSCNCFMEGPFAYCHVFTYSEREGTAAARRDDSVPVPERKRRSAHLRRLSAMKRHDYYEAHLGREMPVLFENPREGTWPGYTPNYIRVVVPDVGEDLTNRLCRVRLESVTPEYVEGVLLEPIS